MLTASFLVNPNLLSVQFLDTSTDTLNNIVSWAWNFGDTASGGQNTSTLQSPQHTFTSPGTYIVRLQITNNAPGTPLVTSITRNIIVNTVPVLPVSLKDFILLKVPPPINIPPGAIDAYVATYQLYMQPLVNSPGVADVDTFNEAAYPPLVNALIAYTVAYQITLDNVGKNLILGSSTGIVGGQPGLVKKIETGPSNAEFQDMANLQKQIYGKNGLLEQLKMELCKLASRLLIKMPMCPPLPSPIFIPLKAGRNKVNPLPFQFANNYWNLYPFVIPIII